MFSIHTASFTLDNTAAYHVLEDYLSLPAWEYWQTISGHTTHSENGWTIKSTMSLALERVDNLVNDDIEVIIIWESFNAKEIASIEVAFYKDSFLSMRCHIMDDLDELSPVIALKQQDEKELFGSKIAAFIESKLDSVKDSATLLMQYKKILENIEENYFSMAGLEQLAKRFGL